MRTDPQQFEREVLANGIEFLWHQHESPVCYMNIYQPVGSAHTGKGLLTPGSPHFLEHALFIQSKHHPEPHSFELELSLRGCERGGTTFSFVTRYNIACPLTELEFASKALFETVYEPFFTEETLSVERGVVQNERDRSKRYWPGRNRINQYINTEFRKSDWVSYKQVFGKNADLKTLTSQILQKLHGETYYTEGIKVLAVGNSDFSTLKKLLSQVKTQKKVFERNMTPATWVDPSFRYKELEGVKHPQYICSWIRPSMNDEESAALMFLMKYLINHVHGPLYDEFRKRQGWTYGVDYFCDVNQVESIYGIDITLQDKQQIEKVRESLFKIALKGVKDQAKVEREIHRRLAFEAFSYQTSQDIIGGAETDLLDEKPIVPHEAWKKAVEHMKDPVWRMAQFEQHFSKDSWGEIALMPEQ